ncbi:MAG: hypothetical protein LBG15_04070 [Dysgonamonadaceae bacterium]|jgi:uncharacterized protein YacL|nr:hypothetical protein [Dysgonamonadaceae bacterium]
MTTNHETSFENDQTNFQIPVPNATAILVLGIISIVGCCCYGVGVIFAIIALVLESNASKQYNEEPARYLQSSYKNMNAGKICAIIGLVLSILTVIYFIWAISFIGWDAMRNPELLQERMQELLNR